MSVEPPNVSHLPEVMRWLFWETDFDALDVARHKNHIIPRVLEFGDLFSVRWALATYGDDVIHAFLRDVGQPELSDRTLAFWRAYFKSEDEPWANSAWRKSIAPYWPG